MTVKRIVENAHKITFLVQQYPGKKVEEIVAMCGMPAIEINTAIWYAVNAGLIVDPTDSDGIMVFIREPGNWQLGEIIETLKGMLVYSFQQLAKKEQDLEENYISNWTMGYQAHDLLISMKQLVNDKVIFTYDLTDPKDLKSTYTFYTLYENGEQMWGRKQFNEEPTGEEEPDNSNEGTKENEEV